MKQTETILAYDQSFNGFLSAVYTAFQNKLAVCGFSDKNDSQVGLFSDCIEVDTDINKARRVWEGLQLKNYSALKSIYFAYLSETSGIEQVLYKYIRYIFIDSYKSVDYDIREVIKRINQLASLVSREKQRLETQTELQAALGEIRLAYVEPAFNVLPLVSKHFRSRYKDHPWIIFDLKRQYGMYFNGNSVEMISSSFLYRLRRVKSQELISAGEVLENRSSDLEDNCTVKESMVSGINAYTAA